MLRDKALLRNEIKLPEADSIKQLVAYRPIIYPHIITSHMWKGVYYLSFDPTVGRIVVIVDVYYEFWDVVGKEKIKTWERKYREKNASSAN